MVRLQKYLASCGVGSRRACEQFIADSRVSVNGAVVSQQGVSVTPGVDVVAMDGQQVFPQQKLYFMLNKPGEVLCTCQDTHGRRTFLDFFPGITERLYPVGRLDQDSEGLLIVTNDGELALRLTHPRHEVAKIYHVRLNYPLPEQARRRMLSGIESEGEMLHAEAVSPVLARPSEYLITLREGRKRQVRRMVRELKLRVLTLQRISVGSLTLGTLPLGKVRALSRAEIETLFREAGEAHA
ncbi:MAG: pseudouridine synthase [bacterium]